MKSYAFLQQDSSKLLSALLTLLEASAMLRHESLTYIVHIDGNIPKHDRSAYILAGYNSISIDEIVWAPCVISHRCFHHEIGRVDELTIRRAHEHSQS